MYFYPNVIGDSFRPEYRNVVWEDNLVYFEAWKKGLTGFPIVDAAMR